MLVDGVEICHLLIEQLEAGIEGGEVLDSVPRGIGGVAARASRKDGAALHHPAHAEGKEAGTGAWVDGRLLGWACG